MVEIKDWRSLKLIAKLILTTSYNAPIQAKAAQTGNLYGKLTNVGLSLNGGQTMSEPNDVILTPLRASRNLSANPQPRSRANVVTGSAFAPQAVRA